MNRSRRIFLNKLTIAAAASALYGGIPMQRVRAAENGVRPAPYMPEPHYVESNGIRMGVYEQGSGVPIVFCHGFPELAFSWRNQIAAVAEAGFRAIAPDQRGYGLTGGPEGVENYDIQTLSDDLIGLLDAKGIDKAIFCGHDWGGALVWAMPRLHPERCLGIIGLNTPAGRPASLPPVEGSEESLIVMSPNYYVATFMAPGRAEAVLEQDVSRSFDFMLSRGGIWDREAFAKLPEDSSERQMDLLAILQRAELPGQPFMSDEVMQYFVDTFETTGFTGGLNWYRAAARMGSIMAGKPERIEVPSLYIGAVNDVILPPSSADGMEDFITDLEKHTVADSGHWTQQEQPEEVNRVILEWLGRKFG